MSQLVARNHCISKASGSHKCPTAAGEVNTSTCGSYLRSIRIVHLYKSQAFARIDSDAALSVFPFALFPNSPNSDSSSCVCVDTGPGNARIGDKWKAVQFEPPSTGASPLLRLRTGEAPLAPMNDEVGPS